LLPLSSLSLSSMPTPGTAQRNSAGSLILGRCLVGTAAVRQCLSCSAPLRLHCRETMTLLFIAPLPYTRYIH
jgi:hypothetical protein